MSTTRLEHKAINALQVNDWLQTSKGVYRVVYLMAPKADRPRYAIGLMSEHGAVFETYRAQDSQVQVLSNV